MARKRGWCFWGTGGWYANAHFVKPADGNRWALFVCKKLCILWYSTENPACISWIDLTLWSMCNILIPIVVISHEPQVWCQFWFVHPHEIRVLPFRMCRLDLIDVVKDTKLCYKYLSLFKIKLNLSPHSCLNTHNYN